MDNLKTRIIQNIDFIESRRNIKIVIYLLYT